MFAASRNSLLLRMSLLAGLAYAPAAWAQGPTPGQNVNMVSGTKWPGGDPFLQRQNEPSIAVSTRNSQHLLAGANDYRTVDLPTSDILPAEEAGDAWLGIFKSFDGGASWQSTLIPGFLQDKSASGLASPMKGFSAASDPVVRAGSNGMFYYTSIAFNRSTNLGGLFLTRFIDLNNKENGDATRYPDLPSDPIRYIGTVEIDSGTAGQFIDKPWMAVDIPRAGALTCNIQVVQPVVQSDGTIVNQTVNQTFPGGNVYLAYAMFVGGTINVRSKIKFVKSSDCGVTWTKPILLSQTYDINQGISMAIDPTTGSVYVAWRVFDSGNDLDTLVVAKSVDGGNTFTKGVPVVALAPFKSTTPAAPAFFDQGTSGTTFRTNAYPAIGVDGNGLVYLAWSQRGVGPSGDARILLATSADGVNWSVPSPVDSVGMSTDDFGSVYSRGHQFMPSIAIVGGQVMVTYYDLRLDHTVGFFTPSNPPLQPDPNRGGKLYKELRMPEGEPPAAVFTPFVDDLGLMQRRHTIDLMVAQAAPSANPVFSAPARVSQYIFGLRGDVPNPTQLQQLQENPPNLPLFAMGSEPFFGDYVDITGLTMVPTAAGGWTFNTAANPNQAPVFYTTWTTNQDVRPPLDGNWKNYTPVGAGGRSVFDPTQNRPNCMPGQEGMRNQNIYSSQITQGLQVSSPQTLKPLSTTLQRAFVVLVQNQTNFDKTFHLSIANQPLLANGTADPSGFASFIAGTNNPGPPPSVTPPSPATTTALDVDIPPHSGITRPVFAVSSNAGASITVNVVETTPPPGNSGLASFVVFNGDPTSPLTLAPPDGVTAGQDIATVEIYSPSTSDPALYNPNAPNPNAPNPNPNTGLSNPNAPNPNAPNPNAPNPNAPNPNAPNPNAPNPNAPNPNAPNPNAPNSVVANPNAPNPNAPNPNAPNTNITNTSIFDAIYTVTNTGNTAASYHVKLVGNNPDNIPLQLAVNKTYQTPTSSSYATPTGAMSCQLTTENHNIAQALINNPPIVSATNLSDPNIQDPSPGNATFSLIPGESALLVLRGYFASYPVNDPGPFTAFKSLIGQVVPAVVSHAANTNTNTIIVSAPLLITTTSLPDGIAGQTYAATQLMTVGGNPGPLTWAITSGALPAGLTLNTSSGTISGSPTGTGTSNFTVQATDSGSPQHTTSRSLSIYVAPSVTLVNPPAGAPLGDLIFRGFYLPSYPGVGLGQATLTFAADTAGPYTITLTVTSGAFHGPVIGSSTATVTLPASRSTFVPLSFNFPSPAITPGSLVAFAMTLVSGPGSANQLFFDVSTCGLSDMTCTTGGPAVETNDTTPLLSTFRRNGVVLTIVGATPPVGAFTPANGNMSTTRWTHTATLLGTGKVLVAGGTDLNGSPLASTDLYDPSAKAFSQTGNLNVARSSHTATLLPDGRVLIAGGGTASAELYNPSTGLFTITGSMSKARSGHTATLLKDGTVLIAGGSGDATAEIFNPASGTFTPSANNMTAARSFHTATLLNSGQVLLVGGEDSSLANTPTLSSAEIYDPTAKIFTATTSSLATSRELQTATLLGGDVYAIGGRSGSSAGVVFLSSAEVFHASGPNGVTFLFDTFNIAPVTQQAGGPPNATTFTLSGASWISTVETYHYNNGNGATAGTLSLQDGSGHVFGPYPAVGYTAQSVVGTPSVAWIATFNLYLGPGTYTVIDSDPNTWSFNTGPGSSNGSGFLRVTGSFTPPAFSGVLATLNTARTTHTATLLQNGTVFICGGFNFGALSSAEVFGLSHSVPSFTVTGSLATARYFHTATLLNDGTVLITGGLNGTTALSSAEIYHPGP